MKPSIYLTIVVVGFLILMAGVVVWSLQTPINTKKYAASYLCPDDSASCRWDPIGPGVSYRYAIDDLTDDKTIKQGEIQNWWIRFTPTVGHQYRCTVVAKNACGESPASMVESMCAEKGIVSTTPTLAPATATPTKRPFPTSVFLKERSLFIPTDTPYPSDTLAPAQVPQQQVAVVPEQEKKSWWNNLSLLSTIGVYISAGIFFCTIGLLIWQMVFRKKS